MTPLAAAPSYDWKQCIQRGDRATHDALFRAYAPGLFAFVARYVGSPAIAEDLVQDLFFALWARRDTMRIQGSVRTYLFTAARNRALNHLKRERVADRFRASLRVGAEPSDPSAPGESGVLAAMQIQRAIDALPPRCRLIFSLCRQRDMPHTQIAMLLGISVKTVEVQMGRALKSLRAHQRELFT
jgi:RNA polymerase sigma-19 factor, ECF subfamily